MAELDFKIIGAKIRERRKALGIKQEYLAEKLGVNPSHVSNIECGRVNPSLTILVQIANNLRCSVDQFLSEEYTYTKEEITTLEQDIIEKLRFKDDTIKEKVLKILEIL